MISSLSVKNIALIDTLEIVFSEGLNVISGETGAGKSILIDGINFVLGDRADRSLVRHGEDFARVEMVFDTDEKHDLRDVFEQYGLEYDTNVIVSRTMAVNGRGDCRVNGRAVPVSVLKNIVTSLVDIHAQHENQSLMNVQNHIKLLDGFAEDVIDKLIIYKRELQEYRNLKKKRDELSDSEARARQIELLEFQVNEIESISLMDGEEDELLEKRKKFYHMEHILTAVASAADAMDGENASAISSISQARAAILSVEQYDNKLSQLSERFETLQIETQDIALELKSYLEDSDFEPDSMQQVEKRLERVRDLKRKYGKSYQEINLFLQDAKQKLTVLYGADKLAVTLDKQIEHCEGGLLTLAKKISGLRIEAAERFEKAIVSNLCDLGMTHTTFKVAMQTVLSAAALTENGADTIEFLISPNKGEPLKPLQKIASGGELSRFMLALKNIIAELDGIDTLIFDEIDTGISGNIAQVVGQKLYNIAKLRQVLVVTHLPQIAAMADKHFLIEKSTVGDKTVTSVTPLNSDSSMKELVRLSGGNVSSETSLNHAKEMKMRANQYKNNI